MSEQSEHTVLAMLRAIRSGVIEIKMDVMEIKERLGLMEAQYASLSRRLDRMAGEVEHVKRRVDRMAADADQSKRQADLHPAA